MSDVRATGELEDANERLEAENRVLREEISALRERLDEVERLAEFDTLLPLPNRRTFMRELDRLVAAHQRYGTPCAVMFIDFVGLKQINDQHGHRAGDAALLHAARLLRSHVRSADLVARIGGDEFGLLLDHLDADAAHGKAAALAELFAANPLDLGTVSVPVNVTAGVAMVGRGDTADDVLERADLEMYRVRRRQRSER